MDKSKPFNSDSFLDSVFSFDKKQKKKKKKRDKKLKDKKKEKKQDEDVEMEESKVDKGYEKIFDQVDQEMKGK